MIVAIASAGVVLAGAAAAVQASRWHAGQRAAWRLTREAVRSQRSALPISPRVRGALVRAGLGPDVDHLVRLWGVAVAVSAAAAVLWPSGRILLAASLIAPPAALALVGNRAARQRAAQLPDALDAVAAGLRSGLALPGAIAGAASVGDPLGPELRGIALEVEGGRPLIEALGRWLDRADDPATGLAGAALSVAALVGGPGARAIDGAAASLRDRLGAEAEASALATQGRTSAAVLTLAPIGFAFLLTSLDPTAGRFLLGTPVGWLCIGVGLGLDLLGAWWMSVLVRRSR